MTAKEFKYNLNRSQKEIKDYKCCFATVAIGSYFITMAVRLNQQLKYYKSQFDHILLIDENIEAKDLDYIKKNNIKYKFIKPIIFSSSSDHYKYTLNKIQPWTLVEYDIICNIDADIILLDNIDFIIKNNILKLINSSTQCLFFNKAVIDSGNTYQSCSTIHMGTELFLLIPNIEQFNNLINYNKEHKDLYIDDELLYYYFGNNLAEDRTKLMQSYLHFGSAPDMRLDTLFIAKEFTQFFSNRNKTALNYCNFIDKNTSTLTIFKQFLNSIFRDYAILIYENPWNLSKDKN